MHEQARSVCEESGDIAACYHVGRHLEDDERIDEAIEMFARSKRLVHALRLAIEHQLDSSVLTLALDCPAPLQVLNAIITIIIITTITINVVVLSWKRRGTWRAPASSRRRCCCTSAAVRCRRHWSCASAHISSSLWRRSASS